MMGLLEMNNRNYDLGNLFVWDALEGKGTPLTDDIYLLDMERLTQEERLVISFGSKEEIQQLIDKHADTLRSQLVGSIQIFMNLINKVFEKSGKDEQLRIMKMVREILEENGGRPDDVE